ncbi:MAG: phytase [Vicinamibacterales bacterium]
MKPLCLVVLALLGTACARDAGGPVVPAGRQPVAPLRYTEPVSNDADDPAIWIHQANPSRSLIVGTNKVAAPDGALVVFGLDGAIRQVIGGLDRPNNVDIETGVVAGGERLDLAVVTERLRHRLRVFRILPDGSGLREIGAVPVLDGEQGERAEPMGIGLYKRPGDGALFAVVAPKAGGADRYLAQYRLMVSADGVTGTLARRFGGFSQRGPQPGDPGEIEAIVVDDELGYVYYADERFGIHKWHADPDHAEAGRELAVFGLEGYARDREGLAIYPRGRGTGYLVSTDQIPGGSVFKLYRREGESGAPHEHRVVAETRTTADDTDGIEVSAAALPGLPRGILVAMHSSAKTFAIFDWARLFPAVP